MEKKYSLIIISLFLLGSLVSCINVQALTYTYNDYDWILDFSGPDVTQPGNMETYTFYAFLVRGGSTSLRITLKVPTASNPSGQIIYEEFLPYTTYPANYTFTFNYNVTIPSDAINNSYVSANFDTYTRHYLGLLLSLVQYPTYTDLETEIANLQDNITQLQSQITTLQNENTALQDEMADLQDEITSLNQEIITKNWQIGNYTNQIARLNSQISTLQAQKADLEDQVDDLTNQVSELTSNKTALTAEILTLQQSITNLNSQITTLNSEKSTLTTQVNTLITEKNTLTSQVNTL
jgi:DNA repair exonuclease SbcCD ATPase subunit